MTRPYTRVQNGKRVSVSGSRTGVGTGNAGQAGSHASAVREWVTSSLAASRARAAEKPASPTLAQRRARVDFWAGNKASRERVREADRPAYDVEYERLLRGD